MTTPQFEKATAAASRTRPATFSAFLKAKPEILAAHPNALDLTETNVVRALSHLRPEPAETSLPCKAHRCHLAEFWLSNHGLPAVWKPRALLCDGVRHGLSLLFSGYAASGRRALLPADVYPVYLDLARAAGLDFETYDNFPSLDTTAWGAGDILLVCNPCKPRGSTLSRLEINHIRDWLAADSKRRVLIDAVYTLRPVFDLGTQTLLATGRAIILHSLSKGWLRPLTMGVVFVPQSDVNLWTDVFRNLQANPTSLRLAHVLLTDHRNFPENFATHLAFGEQQMRELLAKKDLQPLDLSNPAPKYLFVLAGCWSDILRNNGILALPMSMFGGNYDHLTVVSSLPLVNASTLAT